MQQHTRQIPGPKMHNLLADFLLSLSLHCLLWQSPQKKRVSGAVVNVERLTFRFTKAFSALDRVEVCEGTPLLQSIAQELYQSKNLAKILFLTESTRKAFAVQITVSSASFTDPS